MTSDVGVLVLSRYDARIAGGQDSSVFIPVKARLPLRSLPMLGDTAKNRFPLPPARSPVWDRHRRPGRLSCAVMMSSGLGENSPERVVWQRKRARAKYRFVSAASPFAPQARKRCLRRGVRTFFPESCVSPAAHHSWSLGL
jgi:hypothetical protein